MTAPEVDVVEARPPVAYSLEGGGCVATCKGCGWCAWRPVRQEVEAAAADHKKCRADLVQLHDRLTQARLPGYARRRA